MVLISKIKSWLIEKTRYKNDFDKTMVPTKGAWVFIVDHIVAISLAVGCLLSSYIICVYELDIFYKIPTNFDDKTLEGIKTILINISFSYLAGWIIYLLTVTLPKWEERRRLYPVLQDQATNIFNHVHRAVMRFYFLDNPDIRDVDACISKMQSADWNCSNHYPDQLEGASLLESFLDDYANLVQFVEGSLREYGPYYSKKQYRLLENIRRTNIAYMYTILNMHHVEIEQRNIDLHIIPAFKNVLICNKELDASFHDFSYKTRKLKERIRRKLHRALSR